MICLEHKIPDTLVKKRRTWTAADLKQLRKLAGRVSARQIARRLKRTEGAVRRRASKQRIRLRLKRR
jgi:hypothetical protein